MPTENLKDVHAAASPAGESFRDWQSVRLSKADHRELLAARDERDRLRAELAAERGGSSKAARGGSRSYSLTSPSCCIWPDIFVTGVVPVDANNLALAADGLIAWANCMFGNEPPAHFGCVMAAISSRLGVVATAESLSAYADAEMEKMGAAGSPA